MPDLCYIIFGTNYYWSGTTYNNTIYAAWTLALHDGAVGYYDKSYSYYVWPVRGPDSDADGIDDHKDNCPNTCNSEQLDADEDEIGDVCDADPGCGGCGQDPCEEPC